jgi:hypothetical protein
MALIARILGVSLLTSAPVAGLGLALLKSASHPAMEPARVVGEAPAAGPDAEEAVDRPWSEYIIPVFLLACVGGVIGAVAGAAREIVSAQRQKASNWADTE